MEDERTIGMGEKVIDQDDHRPANNRPSDAGEIFTSHMLQATTLDTCSESNASKTRQRGPKRVLVQKRRGIVFLLMIFNYE